MAENDSAVGVILEIPPQALKNIEKAEKTIESLRDTSEKAAKSIYNDFATTMPNGVDAFIRKLIEAKGKLEDVGKADVTLNTQKALQAGEELSTQMRRTSMDVSQAIQSIASLPVDTSSISALAMSAEQAGVTFKQLEQLVKNYERGRSQTVIESPEAMAMNNAIEKLKEYIALKKKSDEQLARAKTDPEKDYLAEQKRLMTDLLNIRKQINAQSTKVQAGRITGNENLKEEEEDLRRLFARYQESYRALQTLNAEKGKDLGAAARTESEVNAEKYKTEVLKQQIAYRQKLSAEITRANELTAQGQQGKTRLGSGEEAAIQRQLNSDYKNMLKIIKEQGELKAKVAAEGRKMTQEEINLIAALGQRYKIYYDDVNRISGAYKNMSASAEKAFASDKSEQMARNAILLADAQRKATAETLKQEEAERKVAEAEQKRALAEKLSAAKLAGQQYAQSYKGALEQFDKIMSGNASGKLTMNLENIKRVLDDLQTAAGKLNLLDPSDAAKAEKLKSAIQELSRIAQQYKTVTSTKPEKPLISPSDAINAAKNARTLQELQTAYKNLKAVMASVDPKSAQWQQMNAVYSDTKRRIDAIRAAMGELHTQAQRTSDVMGSLRNQIAAAFSAQAIMGFIKKMAETRAEFELQNIALRAILQNKDEADRIFAQVQQMAMQSPFTIMQLNTYTKQLAAYRVESEKLLGTTKMLADVSAGLGVDMQRLILAYGQVKSANYLRATEVRQFTEAGLNIAGELAQYFSELQGKMISVGDVMEMITKRMVKFEDVEEVFKRVTSAGGLFYDMQRKQSESLRGQMQRIQDAYAIMMNEIGQSNQSVISDVLKLIRELIQNWRKILPLIASFAAFFAGKGLIMALTPIVKSFATIGALLKDIIKKQVTWNALASKNIWGAVVSILFSVVTYLALANNTASALAENLSRIREESSSDLKESIADFHQLAKTATDATKSYSERAEALESLNRAYKDILPSYMLESEWLEKQKDNYAAVIAKIQEYFQAKEMQKQVDTILASEDYSDAVEEMKELGEVMLAEGIFDATVTKRYTDKWMEQIAQEISTGKVENSARDVSRRLSEIFGKSISVSDEQWAKISKHFQNIDNEINHIQLGTAQAATQAELWNNELKTLSSGQLEARIKETKAEMAKLNEEMLKQQTLLTESGGVTRSGEDRNELIRTMQERYAQLTQQVAQYEQAMANAWSRETSDKIQEDISALQKEITNVSELTNRRNELARTNTGTEEEKNQLKKLNTELDDAKKSTIELANKMGVKLTDAELENIDNLYDLDRLLQNVAEEAFPFLATKAVESATQGETAIKGLIDKVDWLKRAINTVSLGLGFGKVFEDVSTLGEKTQEEKDADKKKQLADIEKKRNEEYVKAAAKRAGLEAKLLASRTEFVKETNKSNADYAKDLRAKAKVWRDQKAAVADMTEAQRKFYFESNHLTQKSIDELYKFADAAEDVANAYSPQVASKKRSGGSGSGKDTLLELFKNRLKAIKDFYKQYEELQKNYSDEEALRRAQAAFSKLFKTLNIDMDKVVSKGMGKEGLAANIEDILDMVRKFRPQLADEVEKELADVEVQIGLKIQTEAVEDMKKQMQEVADNFELSEVFRKIGVTADLVFMLGGKPTTLADYRKTFEDTYKQTFLIQEKYGKEGVKAYEEQLKKIEQLEQKNAIERAKNYVRYLTESVGERAQIELKAMQDINKIRNDETLDQFSKEQAAMQRRKKMQEDLAKMDMDNLKVSDVYVQVFKDLENASKEQLQYVLNRLRELQSTFKDLSPAQVRSLANDMRKLEDAIADKDSFKNMGENIVKVVKYQRERNELLREQARLQGMVDASEKRLSAEEVILNNLMLKRDSIQDKNSKEWRDTNAEVLRQQMLIKGLQSQIEWLTNELKNYTDEIEDGEENTERVRKAWEKTVDVLNSASSLIGDLVDGLDNMGLLTEGMADAFKTAQDVMSNVIQTGTGAIQAFTDPNPIGKLQGAFQALGGAIKLVGSLFTIGDKKKERQIKNLQERVDDLGKAYDNLHDAMEEAFQFDNYNAGFEASMKNLNEQARAYDEIIRLEEAKKKTDKDKLKQYKEAREEIEKTRKELIEARYEEYGSIAQKDYLSEAEAFVSAWLDAYKETGDGLDGLIDHWNEFFENLVIKQAASAIVSKRMKKYIEQINAAIDSGDTGLSLSQTFKEIGERLKVESEQWNADLKAFFDSLGIRSGNGEFVLSDLQKGIQNITEPQAAAIEAYMNSIRFAVFRHTEQLDILINTIQAQYGAGAENPVVGELRGIRSVLDNIYSTLRGVVVSQTGGNALRIA